MKKTKTAIVALVLAIMMAIPTMAMANQAAPTPEEAGLIPIRAFFEDLGADVEWQGEDRSIHIAIEGGNIILFADQTDVFINGFPTYLYDAVVLWQSTSFISERDLAWLLPAVFVLAVEMTTFYLCEESRDMALYDFDLLVRYTFENAVWDYVVYRRFGFTLEELFAQSRLMIENMIPLTVPLLDVFAINMVDGDDTRSMAANYLYFLLVFNVSIPIVATGHLDTVGMDIYALMMYLLLGMYDDYGFTHPLLGPLTDPVTHWFYADRIDGLEVAAWSQNLDNAWTQSIIPGEVALLGISCFMNSPELDNAVIFPFLQEIEDYSHLIIDLRGNGGGNTGLFNRLVLSRIINEPLPHTHYEFFTGGNMAVAMSYFSVNNPMGRIIDMAVEIVDSRIVSAADFVQQNNMINFNQYPLTALHYVAIWEELLHPADDGVNFSGNIWLLVDSGSGSATAGVTRKALSTGFATVVGENTSNIMAPTMYDLVVLPNTGILWRIDTGFMPDATGRLPEIYGLAPNIRNHPGMDALETVMALIAAGDY